MASVTVEPHSDHLQLESIAAVDLRLLSQSELYALSLCSNGAFDPRRCDDAVIPKIDRSVFNESAGSRKQTYSRLRLAPRKPESSFSTTTTTAIPRPHLGAPKSASSIADDIDPERAENSQIIGLLKELFAAGTNGDELVPIHVEPIHAEYSNSTAHLSNAVHGGTKRKRGRPRKNENLAVVAGEEREVVPVKVRADRVINDIAVYENADSREKVIVNKNGNVVDLAALASFEDPYGLELQRRTENLKTGEDMLGFLRGLNGQWGSRRKKKRIVDASEFGDALPRGWKLLLAIKKKEGRVWMIVRRYISPNGRQFVSCKEVSSYLISFFGVQEANLPKCGQSNENIQFNYRMTCGNVADIAAKELNKQGDSICYPPPVGTHVTNDRETQTSSEVRNSVEITNDHEKQTAPEVRNSLEIQTRQILNCGKCTMTFTEQDDLLHHQLSSHRRRRSRFGTSITDGVIIKDGKFECQFCHKIFSERHRYNGHVGAHKRHHMKSDEASPGVLSFQYHVDPVSLCGVPPKESMMQTSIIDDYNAVTFEAKADSAQKPVSPESKFKAGSNIESFTDKSSQKVNVLSHAEEDSKSTRSESNFNEESNVKNGRENEMNSCSGRLEEANDDVAAIVSFASEIFVSDNETNGNAEHVSSRISDCPVGQEGSLESCLPSHFANENSCGAEIDMNGETVSVEAPNQEGGSESVLLSPYYSENTCISENMERVDFTSTVKRSKLNKEKLDNKVIRGFCSGQTGPDKDVTEGNQQNGSGGCLSVPVSNDPKCDNSNSMNAVSTSSISVSKKKRTESSDEETCGVKDFYSISASSVSESKMDTTYGSLNKEVMISLTCGHTGIDKDAVTRVEQEYSDRCLPVSSWKGQLHDMKDNAGVVSVCTMEEQVYERGSESSLQTVSCHEQPPGVKNDASNISTREVEELKLDEFQSYRGNELLFGISHHRLDTQERGPEFGSLVLSGKEQTLFEENATEVCYGMEEPQNQKGSFDNGFLTQTFMGKNFGDLHNMNWASTSSIMNSKPAARDSSNSELNLAFSSSESGIVAGVNFPIEQTFSFDANLRVENSRTENESSLLGPFCYAKTCGDENNLNKVHTSRVWEEPMIDAAVNTVNDKLTISFGSSNGQLDGDVMPGAMWRRDQHSVLQRPIDHTANQLEQSSSCFPAFSMTSDKVESELLGVPGKFDSMSSFGGAQAGHAEHVEFSFLTTQNLNYLPGDSEALSYNTGMGQGFDSAFWLEKDALSLNLAAGNQVTSVCVWCRNEFHHESAQAGTQTGAIGSICPTCSAKVSQQFNFF